MKRKTHSSLFSTLLLVGLVSSCVVYHPHNADIPLLHEKGEMQLDASASISAPLLAHPALNASFSYAPLQALGLQASFSITEWNTYYAQALAGTFFPFGKTVLEGYLGYGYGNSCNNNINTIRDVHYRVDGHYNLYFGQVNLGWVDLLDGEIDFGMGVKGGMMQSQWEKVLLQEDGTEKLEETLDTPHLLFEPQVMFRIGGQKVKLSINVSYAYLTDWPTENNFFNYDRFSASLGLHFRF